MTNATTNIQLYKDYVPPSLDSKRLHIQSYGIGNYLVVLGQDRDSDALTRSNFTTAFKMLGNDETNDVQIHRLGDYELPVDRPWTCGWFEVLLVNPANDKANAIVEEIRASLENYPVLDEEHKFPTAQGDIRS